VDGHRPAQPISRADIDGGRLHGRGSQYDDLQALFLMRLVRLTKLRDRLHAAGREGDSRRALVDAAFRSTLRDCVTLGVEAEAHALIGE
jgi:hypothetical protein